MFELCTISSVFCEYLSASQSIMSFLSPFTSVLLSIAFFYFVLLLCLLDCLLVTLRVLVSIKAFNFPDTLCFQSFPGFTLFLAMTGCTYPKVTKKKKKNKKQNSKCGHILQHRVSIVAFNLPLCFPPLPVI